MVCGNGPQHPTDVNGTNIAHAQSSNSCGHVILPDLPVTLTGAGSAFRFHPRQVATVNEFRKGHARIRVTSIVIDSLHEADTKRLDMSGSWKRIQTAQTFGPPAKLRRTVLLPDRFAISHKPGTIILVQTALLITNRSSQSSLLDHTLSVLTNWRLSQSLSSTLPQLKRMYRPSR